MKFAKKSLVLLCCKLFLSSGALRAESCSELYADKTVKKHGDLILKQSCMLGLSGVGVACSVVGTVLSFGIAAPVMIPLGVVSATLAVSKTAYDGYQITNPVMKYFNGRKVHALVRDAYTLLKDPTNTKPGRFIVAFYREKVAKSLISEAAHPSIYEIAQALITLDKEQALCSVTDLPYGEGRFFVYIPFNKIIVTESPS